MTFTTINLAAAGRLPRRATAADSSRSTATVPLRHATAILPLLRSGAATAARRTWHATATATRRHATEHATQPCRHATQLPAGGRTWVLPSVCSSKASDDDQPPSVGLTCTATAGGPGPGPVGGSQTAVWSKSADCKGFALANLSIFDRLRAVQPAPLLQVGGRFNLSKIDRLGSGSTCPSWTGWRAGRERFQEGDLMNMNTWRRADRRVRERRWIPPRTPPGFARRLRVPATAID